MKRISSTAGERVAAVVCVTSALTVSGTAATRAVAIHTARLRPTTPSRLPDSRTASAAASGTST